jgi:hypothetical protein
VNPGDARNHPLRVAILTALESDPDRLLVPAEFAASIDEPLGQVSYHCRVLDDLGEIEAVDPDPLTGSGARGYKLPARDSDAAAGAQ